jgi:hypothetical protein
MLLEKCTGGLAPHRVVTNLQFIKCAVYAKQSVPVWWTLNERLV